MQGSENIFRITTYDSFNTFLSIECAHDIPCVHDNLDMSEKENLLEKYNIEYFKNKDIIVLSLTTGVNTVGLRFDNITNNGVINITVKSLRERLGHATPSLGILVILSIEIEKIFIPSNLSTSFKKTYAGRR